MSAPERRARAGIDVCPEPARLSRRTGSRRVGTAARGTPTGRRLRGRPSRAGRPARAPGPAGWPPPGGLRPGGDGSGVALPEPVDQRPDALLGGAYFVAQPLRFWRWMLEDPPKQIQGSESPDAPPERRLPRPRIGL